MQDASSGQIMQVAITVSDLARSVEFYRERLGMKFLFNAGTMSFLQCGGVRLLLGTPESGKPISNGGTILYLRVNDLQAEHSRLVEQGVLTVQGPQRIAKMPGHDLWLAIVSDPDGNPVGLMSEVMHN